MDALFFSPDGATRDDATGVLPTLPVPVSYPQSAGLTLLDLEGPEYTAVVSKAASKATPLMCIAATSTDMCQTAVTAKVCKQLCQSNC